MDPENEKETCRRILDFHAKVDTNDSSVPDFDKLLSLYTTLPRKEAVKACPELDYVYQYEEAAEKFSKKNRHRFAPGVREKYILRVRDNTLARLAQDKKIRKSVNLGVLPEEIRELSNNSEATTTGKRQSIKGYEDNKAVFKSYQDPVAIGTWPGRLDHLSWGKSQNLFCFFTNTDTGEKCRLVVFHQRKYQPYGGGVYFDCQPPGSMFEITTQKGNSGRIKFSNAKKIGAPEQPS